MDNMTRFVYLLKVGNVYLKDHPTLHHWTETGLQAKQFQSKEDAEICAVTVLGLHKEDYEILPIRVIIMDSVTSYYDAIMERMGSAEPRKH